MKVTYNTYSCTISGMSREMMEMDGRVSAEYQIWKMKGHNGHLEKSVVTKGQKKHSDLSSPK